MGIVRRRQQPPMYADYRRYKPHLRVDFRFRCCYCSIHESNWGDETHFAVEHFRPKSAFPELETEYSNLYYACNRCNGYKGDKWPSAVDLAAGLRFFDLCTDVTRLHLRDDGSGNLEPLSPCGVYSIASIRLNRAFLVKMRNERRTHGAKLRQLLRDIRFFEAQLPSANPEKAVVIDQLISRSRELVQMVRTKYYRPPTLAI